MPFPALMALRPALKYGIPALAIVVLVGAYFGWKEYQQWQGAKEEHERQQLAVMQQKEAQAADALERLEERNRIVDATHEELQKLRASLEGATHAIERYKKIKTKPCPVTREFVHVYDAISRVPDVSAASGLDAGAGGTASESPIQEATSSSDAGVIPDSAILEVHHATVERLRIVEEEHEGLSLFAINEYRKAKALRDQHKAGSK